MRYNNADRYITALNPNTTESNMAKDGLSTEKQLLMHHPHDADSTDLFERSFIATGKGIPII